MSAPVQVFEDQLRWPGAPPICLQDNLPAFLDRFEMIKFHEETNPGTIITRYWRCPFCKHLHYEAAKPAAPRHIREDRL